MNFAVQENSIHTKKRSALILWQPQIYFYDIIPIFLSFPELQRRNYSLATLPDNVLERFSASLLFSHVNSPHRPSGRSFYLCCVISSIKTQTLSYILTAVSPEATKAFERRLRSRINRFAWMNAPRCWRSPIDSSSLCLFAPSVGA